MFNFFKRNKKVLIYSIDGVPYTFIKNNIELFPNMKRLFKDNFFQMDSVIPTVSSVAWTSFQTGVSAYKHKITGFIDRDLKTKKLFIPFSNSIKKDTLAKILSRDKKKVYNFFVPVSYPPYEVNGKLISCFLCTDVKKGAYPHEYARYLKDKNFKIDIDPGLARKDKNAFLEELNEVFEMQTNEVLKNLKQEKWDYFHFHLMGTDRINHFLLKQYEQGKYKQEFLDYYKKVDSFIEELENFIDENTLFIIMSDHGFCSIKYEVNVNAYLKEIGLLKVEEGKKPLENISEDSLCYSLIPGKIFINLKGRELNGQIEYKDYFDIRERIKKELIQMKDAQGNKVIKEIIEKESLYNYGAIDKQEIIYNEIADLILISEDGYDLKANFNDNRIFYETELEGMHTYYDALFYINKGEIIENRFSIVDITKVILDYFNIETDYLDSKKIIKF